MYLQYLVQTPNQPRYAMPKCTLVMTQLSYLFLYLNQYQLLINNLNETGFIFFLVQEKEVQV